MPKATALGDAALDVDAHREDVEPAAPKCSRRGLADAHRPGVTAGEDGHDGPWTTGARMARDGAQRASISARQGGSAARVGVPVPEVGDAAVRGGVSPS